MKTLQTILAALALSASISGSSIGQKHEDSYGETLETALIDNNSSKSKIELLQDKKENNEMPVLTALFNANYKGKIIKVKSVQVMKDGTTEEREAIYEFTEKMADGIKLHIKGGYFGLTAKGHKTQHILADKDEMLLFENFWHYESMKAFITITEDPVTKKPIVGNLITDGEKSFIAKPLTFTLEEISKKEYDEVNKFKKGIIGKYEAKKLYELKNYEKYVLKLDKTKDYSDVIEQEHTATKTDPETGKETKHRVYVDYRIHVPLELEFNDKGEMIYNPSKYKNPYKTPYTFEITNNLFIYRTPMEVLKVVPEKESAVFRKKRDEFEFGGKIVPIFEPDGQMSLEYHINYDNDTTHVYVLERAK